MDFHQTIMAPWGREATDILRAAKEGELDPYVLVVEGSVPNEDLAEKQGGFWCVVGEEDGEITTFNYWLRALADRAAAVVAAGTCACYGGVVAGVPNPTGATGVLDFLSRGWKSSLGLPVICAAGCPVNGQNLSEILTHAVLTARGLLPIPELDEHHRPTFIYGAKVHETCPRAGFFALGVNSEEFGEPYCMGLMGCKGPIVHCNVPYRSWIDGAGGCTTVGSPCIGCTDPGFPDPPLSPFLAKAPAGPYIRDWIVAIFRHIGAGLTRLTRRRL